MSTCLTSKQSIFNIFCGGGRPAATRCLDEGMLPIDIAVMPNTASDQNPDQYYFGTVTHLSDDSTHSRSSATGSSGLMSAPSQGLTSVPGDMFPEASSLQGSTADAQGTCTRTPGCTLSSDGAGSKCPFEDVTLGHLIGRGSFARVYQAIWNNEKVAVKVRRPLNLGAQCIRCLSSCFQDACLLCSDPF